MIIMVGYVLPKQKTKGMVLFLTFSLNLFFCILILHSQQAAGSYPIWKATKQEKLSTFGSTNRNGDNAGVNFTQAAVGKTGQSLLLHKSLLLEKSPKQQQPKKANLPLELYTIIVYLLGKILLYARPQQHVAHKQQNPSKPEVSHWCKTEPQFLCTGESWPQTSCLRCKFDISFTLLTFPQRALQIYGCKALQGQGIISIVL